MQIQMLNMPIFGSISAPDSFRRFSRQPFVEPSLVMTRPRFDSHIPLTTASLGGDSQDLPAPLSRFQILVLRQGCRAVRCPWDHLPPDGNSIGLTQRSRCVRAPSNPKMPCMRQYSETGGRGPRSSAARVSPGLRPQGPRLEMTWTARAAARKPSPRARQCGLVPRYR